MTTGDFLEENGGGVRGFPAAPINQVVDGSRVASFEANEVIVHQGGRGHARNGGQIPVEGTSLRVENPGAASRKVPLADEPPLELPLRSANRLPESRARLRPPHP